MFSILEKSRGEFLVTTDPAKLDPVAVQAYLSRSYWAQGIAVETVRRAMCNSLCFGLFYGSEQIGLTRVITDGATFAYLCDVYVKEEYCGRGLGKWLMECTLSHPELQNLRRYSLATRDAHDFYHPFGFRPLLRPERVMEICNDDAYKQQ